MSRPAQLKTRIERVDLRELELLELNARFMRHEMYARLVANLKRDGQLTSVPFAHRIRRTKRYRVLSGNHRVRAAIEAGIFEADVMLATGLSEERQLALQLSHNAIAGEDDAAVLRQLYDQIEDVDWRAYAGLDDATLELIAKVDVGGIAEAQLAFQTIAILFLPHEADAARAALETARAQVATDELWLARFGEYDRLLDALADASAAHGIRNQATAFGVLLSIYERHRADLADGFAGPDGPTHTGMVPLAAVLGSDRIPAALAVQLKKALEPIAGRLELDQLWQALPHLLEERP